METAGREACKAQGVDALADADLARATALLGDLRSFGLFFVQKGELEGWLQRLDVPRNRKSRWITTMFERLGADPDAEEYVKPEADDVWEFLGAMEEWIANPALPG